MILRFQGHQILRFWEYEARPEANPLELRLKSFEASDWHLDRKLK
jgi:hypothetical protein